jgi:hypothetical protein
VGGRIEVMARARVAVEGRRRGHGGRRHREGAGAAGVWMASESLHRAAAATRSGLIRSAFSDGSHK